jgi:hypothetical protein
LRRKFEKGEENKWELIKRGTNERQWHNEKKGG